MIIYKTRQEVGSSFLFGDIVDYIFHVLWNGSRNMPKTSIPSGVWGRSELDPHSLQWADKTCAGPNFGEWPILF